MSGMSRRKLLSGRWFRDPADAAEPVSAPPPPAPIVARTALRRPPSPQLGRRGKGMARIATHDCLAHRGSFCSVCRERCPIPGAIRVIRGQPDIDVSLCDGCGLCAAACPAPNPAIAVVPAVIPSHPSRAPR